MNFSCFATCVYVGVHKQTIWCGRQSLRKCRKCQKLLLKPTGANEIGSSSQTKSQMLILFSCFLFFVAVRRCCYGFALKAIKKANVLPSRPQKFNHQCGRQHSRKQLSISILGFHLTKGPINAHSCNSFAAKPHTKNTVKRQRNKRRKNEKKMLQSTKIVPLCACGA